MSVLSHAMLAGGTELVERAVVVVGIAMVVLFALSMVLLFVFSRLPRERQLRIAAGGARLEQAMRVALDRVLGAFAMIVVVATVGLFILSVLLLLVRGDVPH